MFKGVQIVVAKLINKVENIVAKEEIGHHEQFHLWPQCFKKSSAAIASKCVCKWKRVKGVQIVVVASVSRQCVKVRL